jgi:hypothetical protein
MMILFLTFWIFIIAFGNIKDDIKLEEILSYMLSGYLLLLIAHLI